MTIAKRANRLTRLLLAVALALALISAPGIAKEEEAPMTISPSMLSDMVRSHVTASGITFSGSVLRASGGAAAVTANDTTVEIPARFAAYTTDGHAIEADALQSGMSVTVSYPAFSGTVTEMRERSIIVQAADGKTIAVPVSAMNDALRAEIVFVRLSDNRFAKVPLRRAVELQDHKGARIVSTIPPGAVLAPYASVEEELDLAQSIYGTRFDRVQINPSERVVDPSLDGDSNI